jgi:hypothetical protein
MVSWTIMMAGIMLIGVIVVFKYYRYLKHAAPAGEEHLPAVGAHNAKRP